MSRKDKTVKMLTGGVKMTVNSYGVTIVEKEACLLYTSMQLEARGEATFDNLVDATDTLMYYASKHKELTGLSSSCLLYTSEV